MKLPRDGRGLEGGAPGGTDDKAVWWQYVLTNTLLLVPSLAEQAGRKGCSNSQGKHESRASEHWLRGCWVLSTTPRAPIPQTDLVRMVFRECSFSQAGAAGQRGDATQGFCFSSLF